jgi:hypothetical protein
VELQLKLRQTYVHKVQGGGTAHLLSTLKQVSLAM